MGRVRTCASAVVLVVVLLAGCGGSGSTRTSDTSFPTQLASTQAEYEGALAGIREHGRDVVGTGDGDAVVHVYAEMLEATRDARDDYAGLQPPKELRDDHHRLVELLTQQAAVLERLLAAAAENDDSGLTESLQELAVLIGEWATANQALDRALTSTT